jgi:peptidoglycan L-alanyl-D-glutamate endopeptidase CwlK
VVESARSEAKQAKNLTSGASMTAHSRHVRSNNQNKMACAIDMAPCDVNGKVIFWKRLDLFQQMNKEMQAAASRLGLVVEWGGNWKTFKDLDHWQLNWKDYP